MWVVVDEKTQLDSTFVWVKLPLPPKHNNQEKRRWNETGESRWQRSRRRWKASWRAWCVAVPWMSCRCADLLFSTSVEAIRSILGLRSFFHSISVEAFLFWVFFNITSNELYSYTIWDCIYIYVYMYICDHLTQKFTDLPAIDHHQKLKAARVWSASLSGSTWKN